MLLQVLLIVAKKVYKIGSYASEWWDCAAVLVRAVQKYLTKGMPLEFRSELVTIQGKSNSGTACTKPLR